jgi:ubiquinone/menaquinone biosynthesis C-methylase UbiE
MIRQFLIRPIQNFVRFFLKYLYTTIAWAYDLVAYVTSVGQWRNWQDAAVEALPPGIVLELGHGPGHLLLSLSLEDRRIIGLDASRQMVRMASGRLRKAHLPAQIVQGRAQALPFPSSLFDAIFSTFPSEYIFDRGTYQEAWRALKPEGLLVIIPGVIRITGKRKDRLDPIYILDRLASVLYQITGEDIQMSSDLERRIREEFERFGFSPTIDFIEQPRAIVLRIIARKQLTKTD